MKAIAGGLIAMVLLGLYIYLVTLGYLTVDCANTKGCATYAPEGFNNVMAQSLSVISGLVSALIIAELAVVKGKDFAGSSLLSEGASPRARNVLRWTTWFYILAWILVGLVAFIIGLNYPGVLPALTAVGQSWFGISIAIAYSYFGLKP